MSEYSPLGYKKLHVYRHTFEPSTLLAEQIRTLFQPGVKPDFLLQSTKEVYVDTFYNAHERYRKELNGINAVIEEKRRVLFHIGKIGIRELLPIRIDGESDEEYERRAVLRVSIMPEETTQFAILTNKLDSLGDIYMRKQPDIHYLHADFALRTIRHDDEFEEFDSRSEAVKSIITTVSNKTKRSLFTASVVGLTGAEKLIPMPLIVPGFRDEAAQTETV